MATLDQLPPEKRAIIELVLRRGQSYDDIADMLSMPAARVREHAREALVALAPRTAERVDPEWRDQLADYVLGQQAGPQSTATRGHMKRSEPARAWALSTVDSLGELYQDGAEPAIPEGEAAPPRRGARLRRARDEDVSAAEAPAQEKPRPARRERPAGEPAPAATVPADDETTTRERRSLSPEAEAVVRRRRILGALAALLALAGVILAAIFLLPKIFGGDDEQEEPTASTPPTEAAAGEAQVLAQLELKPVEGGKGAGLATVAEEAGQQLLIVQARLQPVSGNDVYEVWLYNSPEDAQSVGAQITDEQGNYVGAGPLPADFERFKFVDISREKTGQDPDPSHSGQSVLRARIAGGQPSPEAGGAAPPGSEPPAPGGTPTLPQDGGGALPPQDGGGALPPQGGGAPPPTGGAP